MEKLEFLSKEVRKKMKENMINKKCAMDRSSILQCLIDVGCDAEEIQKYKALQNEGKIQGQLQLLSQHRRKLLHGIHESQKRIDCLDYLIHSIETNETITCQEKNS